MVQGDPDAPRSADSMTTLRRATESDLPEIVAIYNEAIEHSFATFDVTPFAAAEREGWFAQFDEDNPLIVSVVDGHIAGYAYYVPYRPKPAYRFTKELTVYVGDAHRGAGIGTELYRALIEHATDRGVHALLAVIAGDNPESVALHRKLGFEPVGHLIEVGHKFGQWVDTRFYQKTLSGPEAPSAREA